MWSGFGHITVSVIAFGQDRVSKKERADAASATLVLWGVSVGHRDDLPMAG
jgi:hypothetical protein